MYDEFFKLRERPFLAAVEPSRYFPATAIETARQTLVRVIERADGAGLVIGPPGTGKSMLCHLLAEHFRERFYIAYLASGRIGSREALLQAMLYELGLDYRDQEEGELRLSLIDCLETSRDGNQGLLLLVDEAHTLPLSVLEEVRMITNLVRDGQTRVRAVLAGHPLLEERFASPKLESFNQRLAARCYLEAFDSGETADYVRASISLVGGNAATLVDDGALASIYRATDGIPRLINQLCDHALILASLGGVSRITSPIIDEAWADLQQLPAPGGSAKNFLATAQVIEFGGLDEPLDLLADAIPFRPATLELGSPPEMQLVVIEDHLAHIDDDFHPAGTIGTEVELTFAEADLADPFGEPFVEEEVVLDRYGLDADMFAALPRVTCHSEPERNPLLVPLETSPPQVYVEPAAPLVAEPVVPAAEPRVLAARLAQESVERPADVESVRFARPPAVAAPRQAHTRQYRQLFARLRRR